jgi:2-C-methyl-D-erythritol 4-phosphate cytidylyltransferase
LKESIIIVAGGSGNRIATTLLLNTPKQFLKVGNLPILMHTITRFYEYNNSIEIILVLPTNHINFWKQLCSEYNFNIKHTIVDGGSTRFQSVKNGLSQTTGTIIGVHDGVRPFVSLETITKAYKTASKNKTAVPCVALKDSIRSIDNSTSKSEDRNKFKLVQTPQVFEGGLLKKAYQQEFSDLFTDDASVVEATGTSINLTEGNYENVKITTKEDLLFAEAILANKGS